MTLFRFTYSEARKYPTLGFVAKPGDKRSFDTAPDVWWVPADSMEIAEPSKRPMAGPEKVRQVPVVPVATTLADLDNPRPAPKAKKTGGG